LIKIAAISQRFSQRIINGGCIINEKLLKEFKKCNQNSIFKIRYRPRKTGYSLFLECQRKDLRKTIDLKDFNITDKVSNIIHDKQIIQKAYEQQLYYDNLYKLNGNNALLQDKLKESNVNIFFDDLRNKKEGNTLKNWSNAFKHFGIFSGGHMKFSDITIQYCENYREYLLSKVSPNTTCTYFSIFKAMLNKAVMRNLIEKNPGSYVKNPKLDVVREFLSEAEVRTLSQTEYENVDIKNAFLFSCFTGLRLSDVKNLKWNNIKEGYVNIMQIKTKDPLRFKLSHSAIRILKIQEKDNSQNSDNIFRLLADNSTNKHLKRWVELAGIEKRITFHNGRHTYATMCISSGMRLYTVSKLLGHTDIKNTQIYAKLIDKDLDEAIDKLPII